jgi:hypothetical protein
MGSITNNEPRPFMVLTPDILCDHCVLVQRGHLRSCARPIQIQLLLKRVWSSCWRFWSSRWRCGLPKSFRKRKLFLVPRGGCYPPFLPSSLSLPPHHPWTPSSLIPILYICCVTPNECKRVFPRTSATHVACVYSHSILRIYILYISANDSFIELTNWRSRRCPRDPADCALINQ